MTSPVIQIYDMSDADAQAIVLGLLRDVDDIAVQPAFSGPDRYVIVECADPVRAQTIFTLVTAIDSKATVIHTTNGVPPNFGGPYELSTD